GQVKYYTDIAYKYHYAYIPLRVAYKIKLAGGLSVIPAAGVAPVYNVSSDARATTSTGVPSSYVFKKSKVNRFGALADALLYAEYKIGALSVTAGGSYKHMVNPLFKNGGERLHFLSGDASILYHF
ncbi:MAG: hypothetical protein K0R82_2664, partial [Flavipsychrobacter sp.]|nr:hypothetical protein [Flavipsychrobacter sp.]